MPARPAKKKSRIRMVLLALTVLCVGAYAFASLPAVRARLRRELVEAVRRDFGLEADVGDVSFALPFSLSARRVSLRHPEHGLLASVGELSVSPALRRAAMGELKLKRVVLSNVHVRLRVVDGKIVNLPNLPASDSPGPDGRDVLRELRLRQGRFEIDASPLFMAEAHGVEIAGFVRDDKRLGIRVSVDGGSYDYAEHHEQLSPSFLSGRYSDDKLEIDSARIETTLGRFALKRARIELPFDQGRYQGSVSASVKLHKLKTLPFLASLPKLEGEISAALKFKGTGRRYSAQGTLHAENPEVEGFGFGFLDLQLDLNPDEIRVLPGSVGRIVQEGGEIGFEARIGLGEEGLPVEARANVKRLELHKLMAQLNVTHDCVVNWVLKGGAKISGTLDPVDIKGPIWADHVSFMAFDSAYHDPNRREVIGTPPGRVSGRMVIRPDALRFESLTGKLPNSEIHAMVHVGFDDKLAVTASSPSLDLRDATGLMGMPLTGKGAFALEVGGTYSNTTLTGSLDMNDFSLDGFRLGSLKTRAALEKDGVAVRFVDSVLKKNDSSYMIDDLLLDFSEHFEITAKARLERMWLADFYHAVKVDQDPDFAPYQGRVHGDAVARYTLGFPGDDADGTLRIDTQLEVDELAAYGLHFDGGGLDANWIWHHIGQGTRGAELSLRDAVLSAGQGNVLVRGGMALNGQLQLTVFGEQLSLYEMLPQELRFLQADAELGFAGRVRGTVWMPEANIDVNALGARMGPRSFGDGQVNLLVGHKRQAALRVASGEVGECKIGREALAHADWGASNDTAGGEPRGVVLCATGFGKRLDLDAVVGVTDGLPIRGRLALREVPLGWFVPDSNPGMQRRLLGKISGEIALDSGMLTRADSLFGRAEISTFKLGESETWLENQGPLRFAIRGDGLEIERAELVGRGTHLKLFGGGSLAGGMRAGINGRLDLSVLPSLTPEVRAASGVMDVAVKISGEVRSPSVFGRADLHEASFSLARLSQDVAGLSASFSFSEHEILLESARAQIAGGTLTASGSASVDHRGLGRYELSLNAESMMLEPVQGIEVAFSADTTLRSRINALPELTGTLHIQRAVYKRPISLGLTERLTGLSQARRAERESYDPADDHVVLDVQVVNDGPLRVQNNLISAELSIDDAERPFRIVGTDQRTGALGTLELNRGTLQFRNTQFVLDGGTVTFVDETRVRTRLDFSARTEFRRQADASGARWLIALRARGDADNLKIETSSSPALAQEDIALLLTVGFTRAEAERLGTTALTQGAALEALASVTGVDREVKKALPVIDDFTVTSAYSARTNRTEPQVVVGKRISERVRASATTGLTADSNFKTGVQWRLNDQTAVEAGYDNVQTTTSSQFGNVGVDLRWRLEFD